MAVKKVEDPFDDADPFFDDPFEEAGAVPKLAFLIVKQLGTGAEQRKVVYDRGGENEQLFPKCTSRLLMVKPISVEKGIKGKFGVQDRWTCDVTVFDGVPITAVIDKDGEEVYEPEEPWVPVFTLSGLYISQQLLAKQLDNSHAKGKLIVGRLVLLPGKNKSWAFGGVTPEEKVLIRDWIKANPEPDAFDS
jgi:hypothetical protein